MGLKEVLKFVLLVIISAIGAFLVILSISVVIYWKMFTMPFNPGILILLVIGVVMMVVSVTEYFRSYPYG